MKLVSTTEMTAVEREANAAGLTYEMMMEKAGAGLASEVAAEFADLPVKNVLGLVGSGNNGGDTLVALSILSQLGWKASAYLVRSRKPDDPLVDRFLKSGGTLKKAADDLAGAEFPHLEQLLEGCSVLLDGILGTGTKLPLRDEAAQVLQAVQEKLDNMDPAPFVVAVDCPSGVDNDTGEAAAQTIAADITVTMAAVKEGLLKFPASNYTGELRLAGIGLEDLPKPLAAWESINRNVVDDETAAAALPARPDDAHKGTFGTALIIAGSTNFTGAALLAGEAAYRAGAGLVTLAVPSILHLAIAAALPEATWILLSHEMGVISEHAASVLEDSMKKADAVLIGPGFGVEDTTRHFLERLLSVEQVSKRGIGIGFNPARNPEPHPDRESVRDLPPLVIDADGLKILAQLEDWHKRLPPRSILTPHPGEMAVLTGMDKDTIQAERVETAERFAQEWGHVVVLKGAYTVIATPGGRTSVVPVASAALARAGTGDVLAGLIAGLRAQGVESYSAALAGAWIHAQAGLLAADEIGNTASVLAGDVLGAVPEVISRLYDIRQVHRQSLTNRSNGREGK